MASFLATPVATTLIRWGCVGGALGLGATLMEPAPTKSDFFANPIVTATTMVALRALTWYGGFWTIILGGFLGWAGAAEKIQQQRAAEPAHRARIELGSILTGLTVGYIIGNIF